MLQLNPKKSIIFIFRAKNNALQAKSQIISLLLQTIKLLMETNLLNLFVRY